MSPMAHLGGPPLLGLLRTAALVCAMLAALIQVWYLWRHPPLGAGVRILLLLGLGLFPIATAMTGNVAGYEQSKRVVFCGSCHVMKPWVAETFDRKASTLAGVHSRSEFMRDESCYACHADYGLYGAVTTKLGGMHHFIRYYSHYARSPQPPRGTIRLYVPYSNDHCTQCHSGTLPSFVENGSHAAFRDDIVAGRMQCVNEACHGPAHPSLSPED